MAFVGLLFGCHSGGHSPFAIPQGVSESKNASINANGQLPAPITFTSGAKIETTEDNTMTENVVVHVTETKTDAAGLNPIGNPAYVYVYEITAELVDNLGNKTEVSSLEKPLKITLPTEHLGTEGICYVGVRENENSPWKYSRVSDDGTVYLSQRSLRAATSEKLSKSYAFGLFKMGVQIALFVYNKPIEEASKDISVASIATETTALLNYDDDGKYLDNLDISVKLAGDNLSSLSDSAVALAIIYRTEKSSPVEIKANDTKCEQTTEQKSDDAVAGKKFYVHTLKVSKFEASFGGEAEIKFTLNLKGLSISDFPSEFLLEVSSADNIENLIPFSYSSSMEFTAEQASEPEPATVYTITYDLDGGSLAEGVTNPSEYSVDTENFTLNNPIKSGYTFAGWTGTDLNEATKEVTITKGSTGDRTYTATWTENAPDTYTLTLSKGTGIATVTGADTYTAGQEITIGYTLSDGYEFVSWSGDDVSVGEANKFTMPAKDIVITANARPISYSITYNLDNGTVATANPTTYDVTSATITLNNPTKTGYSFIGWTGSNGEEPQTTVTIEQGSTGAKSYTANYSLANYAITYNLNDGTVETANPSSYDVTSSSITLNNPTKTGYTFKGWSGTGLTGDSNTSVSIAQGSTGDREYTANWTVNSYKLDLIADTGIATVTGSGTYEYNSSVTASCTMEAGYEFVSWTGDIATDSFTMPAQNATMTANAKLITYTISYDLATGTLATANPASYDVTSATITLNNPTREGFDFLGWTGTGIAEGTASKTLTIPQGSTENRSYVASWTESDTGVLTFTLSDGVTLELKKVPEKDYYMGTYEVTQEQYFAIMNTNPSSFRGGLGKNVNPHGNTTASSPVECVSWNDIMDGENSFKAKITASLTAQLTAKGLSGYQFTLPTQEQWVYTCNADGSYGFCKGANGDQVTDSTLGDYAWYTSNSGDTTHTVGSKNANYWGFYDMHGNVYEWTSTVQDDFRIVCGGSWIVDAGSCRSDYPNMGNPAGRNFIIGFRVVLVAPAN